MTATTSTLPAGPAQYRSVRWLVAIVVLAANTMDLLDATIVNVAGPSIRRELGGGVLPTRWRSPCCLSPALGSATSPAVVGCFC
jgi:hypothetical protein